MIRLQSPLMVRKSFSLTPNRFLISTTQTETQQTKPRNNPPTMKIKSTVRHPNFIGAAHRILHIISENQSRENIHKWLSPPDPSTNHKIACDTYNKKTATWFFQGSIYREWKSIGSLLWIHGKRAPSSASYRIPSDEILNYSWLRQEYSLVS